MAIPAITYFRNVNCVRHIFVLAVLILFTSNFCLCVVTSCLLILANVLYVVLCWGSWLKNKQQLQLHILIAPLIFSAAEMNRHHYSLYVHNCRLILLLRQDPSEADNYKPAEFHWKLDQVSCIHCQTLYKSRV